MLRAVLWAQLGFFLQVDFFRGGVSTAKSCNKIAWKNLASQQMEEFTFLLEVN